jgi:hypothetical protein
VSAAVTPDVNGTTPRTYLTLDLYVSRAFSSKTGVISFLRQLEGKLQ